MGRQFARNVAKGSCVNSFVPQTFRSFVLCTKNSEEVVVKGITMLRFTIANETYMNSTQYPGMTTLSTSHSYLYHGHGDNERYCFVGAR
jgi:predicted metal-binding transcription factor (methanogenesis marker protein 9)